MPNLASSPHHTLLLLKGLALTGLALMGFLALTYLAFHQPTSVLAANASKVTSDTMVSHHQSHYPLSHQNRYQSLQPKHHSHQANGESASSPSQNAIFERPIKSPAKSSVSSEQNSRLVDALLVMGGLGCH